MNTDKNLYQILNIPEFSNIEKIKSAYKILLKTYHPDKGGDSQGFINLYNAYKSLSDMESKENYDKRMLFDNEIYNKYDFIDEDAYEISRDMISFICNQCMSESVNKISLEKEEELILLQCVGCSMRYKLKI